LDQFDWDLGVGALKLQPDNLATALDGSSLVQGAVDGLTVIADAPSLSGLRRSPSR